LNFRIAELAHFGDEIAWLTLTESSAAFDFASRFSSTEHYGLNSALTINIERIDASIDAVDSWLTSRCVGDFARVVFGREAVFDVSTQFFRNNWRDIFRPSRDDAIICSVDDTWVLFYCHENEFEFGHVAKCA